MDGLRFQFPIVFSLYQEDEGEERRLCAMESRLRLKTILPPARIEPGPQSNRPGLRGWGRGSYLLCQKTACLDIKLSIYNHFGLNKIYFEKLSHTYNHFTGNASPQGFSLICQWP